VARTFPLRQHLKNNSEAHASCSVQGSLSPGLSRQERDDYHSYQSSGEVKKLWNSEKWALYLMQYEKKA
jgi:hypothetical protein